MKWAMWRELLAMAAVVGAMAAALSCEAAEERVRGPVVAGAFYPADAAALQKAVDGFLDEGAKKLKLEGKPIALIAPHAGYTYSGRCAGVAYAAVKGKAYKRVIVLAVNHRGMPFQGGSILNVDAYKTPLGTVPVDRDACGLLRKSSLFTSVPSAHRQEHSLEVQLPFLQRAVGSFQLVPIVVGAVDGGDAAAMAAEFRKVIDADTLVVASSDFTHYGANFRFTPFADHVRENIEKLDKGAAEFIVKRDGPGFTSYVERTGATICGRCPIRILLQLLPEKAKGELVEYYASGDENRDYRHSVSYAGIVFTSAEGWGKPDEKAADAAATDADISVAGQRKLLDIARKTVVAVTAGKPIPDLNFDDAELQSRHGVFVTLHKKGQLRGCIGNFRPTTPLYRTVAVQARMSALEDRRFSPVKPDEVPDLDIEISVLMPEKPIKNPLDWEFGKHGIIVRRDWQQATFLPQVAESFETKEQMLCACCRKAGMMSYAWRDAGTKVLIYRAQVFGEKQMEKK